MENLVIIAVLFGIGFAITKLRHMDQKRTDDEQITEHKPSGDQLPDGETPILILKQNRAWASVIVWFMGILLLYGIFGVIIPVLRTGDFNAIWPTGTGSTGQNIGLFYVSCILAPLLPFYLVLLIRKAGNYFFYNDRLELHPFWFKQKVVVPYCHMYVVSQISGLASGLTITADKLPSLSHPFLHFKIKYLNGIGLNTIFSDPKVIGMKAGLITWVNPEDGPKAIQILKEKAFSYEEC